MDNISEIYLSFYPLLENAASGDGSFFKTALGEIKREFKEYNITGAEKAKLLIGFITSAHSGIASSAQKGALELARLACTLPAETAQAENAAANLAKEAEVKAAQLIRLNAETELILKRIEALSEQAVSGGISAVFRAVSEMMGNMAQGGIAAPLQLIEASRAFICAAMRHINSLKPGTFTDSEMQQVSSGNVEMNSDNRIGG
jgi:hypothetical protein